MVRHEISLYSGAQGKTTFGSFFSGVGGADLGLTAAGMRSLWTCEFDRQCQDVLRFHNPTIPNYPDVRTFPAEDCDVPDVLAMSPPCQDLSVAGNRKGLAGERSGLFYDAIRAARVLARRGTRYLLMEQVPGLFSSNGGDDLRCVLRAFVDIGALDVGWRVLDSQWFGVAQRRRRGFFVVDFGGERAGQILALAESLSGHPKPRRTSGEASPEGVAGCLGGGSGARGFCDDLDRAGAFIPEVAGTLNCDGGFDGQNAYSDLLIPEPAGFDHAQLTSGANRSTLRAGLSPTLAAGGTMHVCCAELTGTLMANGAGMERTSGRSNEASYCVAYSIPENHINRGGSAGGNGEMCLSDVTPTVDARHHPHAVAFGWNKSESQTMRVDATTDALQASPTSNPAVATMTRVRRLMPVECERLQGWPDEHTRYGRKVDGTVYEMADGPRYRMCGNGVTSNVAEWIGRNLMAGDSPLLERELGASGGGGE